MLEMLLLCFKIRSSSIKFQRKRISETGGHGFNVSRDKTCDKTLFCNRFEWSNTVWLLWSWGTNLCRRIATILLTKLTQNSVLPISSVYLVTLWHQKLQCEPHALATGSAINSMFSLFNDFNQRIKIFKCIFHYLTI